MLDDFNTHEKIETLFSEAKVPAGKDDYLIAYSTWPTSAMILGGAGTQMTANVDSAYGGYLVQICDSGLNLLPLVKKNKKTGMVSASRMDLSASKPIHLDLKKMVSFKNRPANGFFPMTRAITIEMDSGKKYVWMIHRQEKSLPWHESGFQSLLEFGKKVRKG